MTIINHSRSVRQSKFETAEREIPEGVDPLKLCLEITEDFGNALDAIFQSAHEHDIDLTEVKVALSVDPNTTPTTVKLVLFAHGLGYDDIETPESPENPEEAE